MSLNARPLQLRRGSRVADRRRGFRGTPRQGSAGYTAPTGATAALLDIDPSTYADIDSVVDASGAMAGTFTKAGTPTLEGSGAGAYLDFDGVDERLSLAAVPFTSDSSAVTVYVVATQNTANQAMCGFAVDASDYAIMYQSTTTRVESNGSGGAKTAAQTAPSTGAKAVYAFELTSSANTTYVNGSAGTPTSGGSAFDLTGGSTYIGDHGFASYGDVSIYRIFVDGAAYSSTLNATLTSLYGV